MKTTSKSVTRPSLSQQIDRLDNILEGLSEALQGSVSAAVKESLLAELREPLRLTFQEAVREALADPCVWPANVTPVPALAPSAPNQNAGSNNPAGSLVKVALALESGWRWLKQKGQDQLKAGGHKARWLGGVLIQGLSRGWQALLALLPLAWMLRLHVLIASAIGLGWGVLTLMASPTVALVLNTVAGSALILLALIAGHLWVSHLIRGADRAVPKPVLGQEARPV